MWCERVVNGNSDSVGSSSRHQRCDVGLERQVTSTVTHYLNTIHPLHVWRGIGTGKVSNKHTTTKNREKKTASFTHCIFFFSKL